MIGTKIYQKKSQALFFLVMYGVLALGGIALIVQAVLRNQIASNAAGFMIIFGLGMFIMTLVKSRKPQIFLREDFLELSQSRTKELVRYRNIVRVSRPDKNRIVITLRDDKWKKDVIIWLKDLDPADVEKVFEFLETKRSKG
ncbi:MAG: hypothetical protein C0402_04655 [Thermodesulfovibrio sp.]|nr:hypothetical protein [Thermodesulfovibrio sp.]